MAIIQSKTGKSRSKTYYVVVSDFGKHKWLKAESHSNAKKLKKQVEKLTHLERLESLNTGIVQIRIDDFIEQYLDHVELHNSPVTAKRYRVILNTFYVFLRMFHSNILFLSKLKGQFIYYERNKIVKTRDNNLLFSASDLCIFLECSHPTCLSLTNLNTPLEKDKIDEETELIRKKGLIHEQKIMHYILYNYAIKLEVW